MPIIVKHTKTSAIPDAGDTTLVQPSDWNADHTLTGLGTMAEQDANNVSITGGSISGVTVSGYIPTTQKGAALGVATLDAGGKVPVSELPAAVLGALSYQGTWNASTNTPTLASGTGTKGYYYVVAVAGSTDLDGITDWQIGDWAVYNGTAWQKVDNTDAGGDVVGPSSSTDNAIARFDSTTGKLIQNSVVTVSDTGAIAGATTITDLDYLDFDTTYATTLGAGQLGWNGNDTLGLGMIGGNVVQHIGEDTFFYVKASATITKGQLCMFTGAVGSSGVLTAAPATAIPFAEAIIGVAAENIANNGFGLVQSVGTLRGVDTSAFLDGDILYYNSAVTGGLTKVFPTSGPIVIAAAVAKSGSGGSGILTIRISFQTRVSASTGISVVQGNDTVAITNTAPDQVVSLTGGGTTSISGTYPNFTITSDDQFDGTVTSVDLTAGTGISVSGGPITTNGSITVTNTAPDQVVSLTGAGTTSISGTYPNFTISSDDQFDGTVTSVGGTGTVNGITLSGTVTSSGNLTLGGTLSGVSLSTQVTGTLPIANGGTGETTRQAAMDTLAGAVTSGQYLRGNGTDVVMSAIQAADVPTLNQNTTGSAGSVANALTAGTGLTASATFNGSAAVTFNATGTTINSQTSAYTLVATDAGKAISITTGGVTIPNAVMSAGNIVTIYNNSGSSQTITQGSGVTLQWAGQPTSSTGNRTVGLYGMVSILFISSSVAVISGAGLS